MNRGTLIWVGLGTLSLVAVVRSPAAHAAGTVGSGTPASCTNEALNAALLGGGLVTFNCGPDAVTIDITASASATTPTTQGAGNDVPTPTPTPIETKTIGQDTSIDGAGLVTISGGHRLPIFRVSSGITFIVQNLTIADADGGGGYGGGISSRGGTVIVSNSMFSGNTAGGGYGGAIAILSDGGGGLNEWESRQGMLTVINSTFNGNSAANGIGGAIAALRSAAVVVSNSTFSDNSAYRGGGIFFSDDLTIPDGSATLTITNSTFSGNSAKGDRGGGLLIFPHARGRLTVSNCTFFENTAVLSGAAIQKGCDANGCTHDPLDTALTVANTIVAGNARDNCGVDTTSALADGGHNIDDGATCGFSMADGSLSNTNPQLDPAGLHDNGGPTDTIALQAGSPAIDAGSATICAGAPVNNLDQRGFVRPETDATTCSIGAYEYTAPGPSDCCECASRCADPIDGSCGDCAVVFDAACREGSLCVRHTPGPTTRPTPSLRPTLSVTATPSPTATPIAPSPTSTLGPSACCQCPDFCAAPIDGTCGGCIVVRDASCTGGSLCVPRTPQTTSGRCMGDCSGKGQVTVEDLVTMVNAVLGTAQAASCSAGLVSALAPNSQITILEIVRAVNNALDGCPAGP